MSKERLDNLESAMKELAAKYAELSAIANREFAAIGALTRELEACSMKLNEVWAMIQQMQGDNTDSTGDEWKQA